ncbi:MAG: hypothetical protein FJ398_13110 [Verrucomicrobia bacterium]|nr:hypothetical protein [Verrucomicrobiota bacterium]
MNMNTQAVLFEAINAMEERGWAPASDVSRATKQSVSITKAWQNRLIARNPRQFKAEVPIGRRFNEKIDIVDVVNGIAYELKLSSKNPHHEFFKDVFKVIVYNKYHKSKLKTFAFISEESAAKILQRGLGKEAIEMVRGLGVSVEFPCFICH